jgi:hypothetical protein
MGDAMEGGREDGVESEVMARGRVKRAASTSRRVLPEIKTSLESQGGIRMRGMYTKKT